MPTSTGSAITPAPPGFFLRHGAAGQRFGHAVREIVTEYLAAADAAHDPAVIADAVECARQLSIAWLHQRCARDPDTIARLLLEQLRAILTRAVAVDARTAGGRFVSGGPPP